MGVKRNFLFNTVLTVSNYIFPFIVYPYVARVLGVHNIGICNFVDSIVNYAMLFSLLGISVMGTREIAKAASSARTLDATFTGLFVLTAITTLASTAALVAATLLVPTLAPYRPLLWIGVAKLWGNFLLIDWFYRGIEDFRYITVRTIAVKTAYVVAVFVFIHQAQDYTVYYLLLCLSVVVNAAFNCARACRLVSLRWDYGIFRSSIRPYLAMGVYLLLNTMYMGFNVVYLGFVCGDTEVGYYTTSTKIFQLVLAVYTAYSTVVMPRASAMISQGRHDEFMTLVGKSVDGLLLFSVPVAMLLGIYVAGVVDLIAGPGYGGAIAPMAIVMPLLFVIGYEQILIVQILTPMGRDRAILTNAAIGAFTGLSLNLLLVGRLGAVGSAVVWVAAEVAVMLSAQRFASRYTGIRFPWRGVLRTVVAWLPYAAVSGALVVFVPLGSIPLLGIGTALFAVWFFAVGEWVLPNPMYAVAKATVLSLFNHKTAEAR